MFLIWELGIGDWRPTYFVDMGIENCMRVGMGMVFVSEDWNWLGMGSVEVERFPELLECR